jgi:DNA polymerase-3 subunit alpha
VNKKVVEALAEAGAFDSFEIARHEVFLALQPKPKPKKGDPGPDQLGFFAQAAPEPEKDTAPRDLQEAAEMAKNKKVIGPWTYSERLRREHNILGFWITGHPLDRYSDVEERLRTCTSIGIVERKRNEPISLVGIISSIHKIPTKRGDQMTFVTLTDRVGMIEVILFPPIYERYKALIVVGTPVLAEGTLERDGSEGKVSVDTMGDLRDIRQRIATSLDIHVQPQDSQRPRLEALAAILEGHPGECPLRMCIDDTDGNTLGRIGELPLKVNPRPDLFDDIEKWSGRPNSIRLPG